MLRGVAAGLAAMAAASVAPAHADVMEIDGAAHVWIAGGPRAPDAPVPAAGASALVTRVAPSAGPAPFRARLAELAARYDISPSLLEAVVWQESRWNPAAVSPAGARGLAQLMPGTARQMGVDPGDAMANLEGGARYLRLQLDAFDGDLEKALAAYNAGPRRVQRAGGVPAIPETRAYVAAIMARLSAPLIVGNTVGSANDLPIVTAGIDSSTR
jgi:soluble lytic murein transglycosylase-like protein